ncbi:Vacuolar protein sorting-associated protein 17 [Lithohypha guttulata]|uniref:Vacuolar protein sorting-associated protein 17 n=1 Tax=Lithohypha guttulata TaxID=1690604 RepID=A0AAN7SXB6_9EURO|nr:Vacuolar protein sorting-associated protein 17 [Lithohypha guttulata]
MDYSAAIADDPAAASPWGSSSPRAHRTPFAGSVPDSPTGPIRSDTDEAQSRLPEPALETPTGPSLNGQPVPEVQGSDPRQAQQQVRPSSQAQHPHGQQYTQQDQQQQSRPGATNLPKFRTTQFRDVRRTHSEFIKLQEHLISSNPETIVPAVPPALTSAGAGTEEDEIRVKANIQRWLNIVCSNEVLMRDEEMVFFVEADFGYSPVVRMKQPATGVRRKVLKQFAPPPDDTPELHFARPIVKAFYLATLDSAQRLDKVVKARRGLGLAESSLGEKVAAMHVQETHPGLSHAYRKLGRVIQSCGDFHAAQGTAEATTLADALNYHSADAFIVKETLTNRHILLRELVQAEQIRRSKESAATRLKSGSSIKKDKVEEAITQLDEASQAENFLRGKTQRVTQNLLAEKRRWFDRSSEDMLNSIRDYVLRQIDHERRMLATLESVRPDIRAIDASGGLSRLGREHFQNVRKASMASSQTARGDAWSGVQRSRDALSRSMSGSFVGGIPEAEDETKANEGEAQSGRPRSGTGSASLKSVKEDEDNDRVDARNAASRLAQSTF